MRERFGVSLVPLYLYQANGDIASVSSWYRAGYGWLDSYGSGYGRRCGCGGIPEDVWFCERCRMVNLEKWCESVELECVWKRVFVADFVVQNRGVETGNDRLFPCGRVDPKTKNDGASFAHDGDKHLHEPKHRTRVLHSPCISVVPSSARIQLCECWTEAVGKCANGLQGSWSDTSHFVGSDVCDCVDGADGYDGPMASMVASMDPMASMVASMDPMASMASMVVPPMAPMVSMVASMAPMASMVVASMDGVDGWRRWMASMVGVEGGLGSSAQRALTWKSLCVPSGEDDTHSGSLLFVRTVCRISVAFVPVSRSHFVTICCVSCSTVWPPACVSFFTVFVQFRHSSVYHDSNSHNRAVLPLT